MPTTTFSHEFNYETFKGKVSFPTGIFIDGQFSAGSDNTIIEYVVVLCTSYQYLTLLIHTSQRHQPL
jgi:hypothetical protein